MNKGIWKFLTITGFLLSIIVILMIFAVRIKVFDFNAFSNLTQKFFHQSQIVFDTQVLTQQTQQNFDDLNSQDIANMQRLQQGCFSGNDCIPSLDRPKFVSSKQAEKFLKDDDWVIGLTFNDSQKKNNLFKAYPLKILNWHEVVNDDMDETPVLVTYSPLSMTPRVYERTIDGKPVDFGVSGMLLNSDFVMYDRTTKSLWNQFDGQALVGEKRHEKLLIYPSVLMHWKEWAKQYPQTEVLSEETGFNAPYDKFPYEGYAETSDLYFPLEYTDNRLNSKEKIFGIAIGNQEKAYSATELQKASLHGGTFTDEFANVKLSVTYKNDTLNVMDTQTKKQIPAQIAYYFVWEAFYPNTEIFKAPAT